MKQLSGESGFSITELLISVIIISIGVVGYASALGLASTELMLGRRDTDVALLTADQLERLKAMDYGAVQNGQRTEGNYRLEWEVNGDDPKTVVLATFYPGRDGVEGSDTTVIYIHRW